MNPLSSSNCPYPSLTPQQGHVSFLTVNGNDGRERVNCAVQNIFMGAPSPGLPTHDRITPAACAPSQAAFPPQDQNLHDLLNGLHDLLPDEFPGIKQRILTQGTSPKNLMTLIRYLLEKGWDKQDEVKKRRIEDALYLFSGTGYLHLDLRDFSSFPTHVQQMLQLSLPLQGKSLIVSLGKGKHRSFSRFEAFLGRLRACSYQEAILSGPMDYYHFFDPLNRAIHLGEIERLTLCNNDSQASHPLLHPLFHSNEKFRGLQVLTIKNVTNGSIKSPKNIFAMSPQLKELWVENAPWINLSSLLAGGIVEKHLGLKINGKEIAFWAEGLNCSAADCAQWRETQLPEALDFHERTLQENKHDLLQKRQALAEKMDFLRQLCKRPSQFGAGSDVRMTDDDTTACSTTSPSLLSSASSSSSSAFKRSQETPLPKTSRKRKRRQAFPETSKDKLVYLLQPFKKIQTPEYVLYEAFKEEKRLGKRETNFLEKVKDANTVAQLKAAWEASTPASSTLLRLKKQKEKKAVFILANHKTLKEKSRFFDKMFSRNFEERAEKVISLKCETFTRPAMCAAILMTHVYSLGPQRIDSPEQCFSDLFKASGFLLLTDFSPLLEFSLYGSQPNSFFNAICKKNKENPFWKDIESGIAQWSPTEVDHLTVLPMVLEKLERDKRGPKKFRLLETFFHRFPKTLTESSPFVNDLKQNSDHLVHYPEVMLLVRAMLQLGRKKKREEDEKTIADRVAVLLKTLSQSSLHWDLTDFSSFHATSQKALISHLPPKGESIALSLQRPDGHKTIPKSHQMRFQKLLESIADSHYKKVILDGPMPSSYPHLKKGRECTKEIRELTLSNVFSYHFLLDEERRAIIDLGDVPEFPLLEKLTIKNVMGPRVMITRGKNIFRMSPRLKELWLEGVPAITLDYLLHADIIEICPHLKINGKDIFHWPEALPCDVNTRNLWKWELPHRLDQAIQVIQGPLKNLDDDIQAVIKKLKYCHQVKEKYLSK